MELQGEHPEQWWLLNEVCSPEQPRGREEEREGKQPGPMAAPGQQAVPSWRGGFAGAEFTW